MSKYIFLIFLSYNTLYSAFLQPNYFFKRNLITAYDLNVSCNKNFEILEIPEGKNYYRINAQILLKSFELNGCPLEGNAVRFVTFTQESNNDFFTFKEQVSTFFTSQYPTLRLESVEVIPHGYIDSLPPHPKAIFEKNAKSKSQGIFYVIDIHGIRRYFDFQIRGTLSLLHTRKKVSRNEILSSENSVIQTIDFKNFRDDPLIIFPKQSLRFCTSLKENTPLLARNLEPLPIVEKNSKVMVIVKNDSVMVEFSARAIQEGALYDIITIEKADGKRVRAKVIGENQVELL